MTITDLLLYLTVQYIQGLALLFGGQVFNISLGKEQRDSHITGYLRSKSEPKYEGISTTHPSCTYPNRPLVIPGSSKEVGLSL